MLSSSLRPALLIAAALVSGVLGASSASFAFSDCARSCVGNSGCGTNQPKCMCKAASGNLLYLAVNCMAKACPDELNAIDADLLSPMQTGCTSIGQEVSESVIEKAESLASSAAPEATPTTTSSKTTHKATTTSAVVKTTTTTAAVSSSTKAVPASSTLTTSTTAAPTTTSTSSSTSSTSSSSEDTEDSTTTVAPHTSTGVVSPGAATTTSHTSRSSTHTSKKADPTDSSPFASTNENSAPARGGSWLVAALPLAVVLVSRCC